MDQVAALSQQTRTLRDSFGQVDVVAFGAHRSPVTHPVTCSARSVSCVNYIRQIVDRIKLPSPDPALPLLNLSIGDPTVAGNLPPPEGLSEEIGRVVREGRSNGYLPAMGLPLARAAVARSVSTPDHPVTVDDVFVGSGCSHALLLAIDVLCDAGTQLLVPSPGFSLYRTLTQYLGIEARLYRLDPDRDWEIDLAHLESLITPQTRAILVNNPSNPCGANYSRAHLEAVLRVAAHHHLPIISDEVYAEMVFGGRPFTSLAHLSTDVPVLLCGGLAKRYMIPGWRVGWLALCDRGQQMHRARLADGVQRLSQMVLGASSLTQAVVPYLLEQTPPAYHARSLRVLEDNAAALCAGLAGVPGLSVVVPQAAMYCLVRIDLARFPFPSEVEFCQALLQEQQVFVLPGSCFTMPSFFRVVLCAPVMVEASKRLGEFARKHFRGE